MSSKYKVCHLTTAHPVFDIRIFQKQCKTLAETGYEVTLIAQHQANEEVDGVNILALPKAKNRIHRMFVLTFKAFKLALKQKSDVYHFHDPELLLIGLLLKVFTGKKVVYDVHEDYSLQVLSKPYLPWIVRKSIANVITKIERLATGRFDGIVTATESILSNFDYHEKVLCLRNFPAVSKTSNGRIEDHGRREDVFNLVYAGVLSEIRGVTQIVKALDYFDSNKRIHLTLCGRFSPDEYEHTVKRLKGFDKVDYLGWLAPAALAELYRKSDVGIICFLPEPNHVNAMPNKFFEYMAAGLPIVVSDFPVWKEILERDKCGIAVNPLNCEDIAVGINYLWEHPVKKKEMGNNGRMAFLRKYNWENECTRLVDLYNDFVPNENGCEMTVPNYK